MNIRLLFMVLAMAAASPAWAYRFLQTENYVLPAGQVLEGETLIIGTHVTVSGESKDDLYVLAQNVTIAGVLNKDAWFAADLFSFTGETRDSLRVVARQAVQIKGRIGENLAVVGTTAAIGKESEVAHDLLAAGDDVICEGIVGGKTLIVAKRATLSGTFAGGVRVIADDIVALPGTRIGGDLVYTSDKELFLNEGVTLGGTLLRKDLENPWPKQEPSYRRTITLQIFFYLAALAVGIPFVGIFPDYAGRSVRLIRRSTWKCALIGVVALCLIPLLAVLAAFTLIGLPLAVLLGFFYLILLYLGKIVVALTLGGILLRWQGRQTFGRVFTALSLGLMLIYGLALVPVLSPFIALLVLFFGLGGLVLALFTRDPMVLEIPAAPSPLSPPEPGGQPPSHEIPPKSTQ